MRKPLWYIALAATALLAPMVVSASTITYSLDYSVGAGTVSGTITTDGVTGTSLSATDIVDWDLTLSDGTNPSVTLEGPLSGNNSQDAIEGADLTATTTQLVFNFAGGDEGSFDFELGSLGDTSSVLCYEAIDRSFCDGAPTGPVITLDTVNGETNYVTSSETGEGDVVIASVAGVATTPEAGTSSLMLFGLISLGAMMILRRRSAKRLPQAI